jgi:hypothetical protein
MLIRKQNSMLCSKFRVTEYVETWAETQNKEKSSFQKQQQFEIEGATAWAKPSSPGRFRVLYIRHWIHSLHNSGKQSTVTSVVITMMVPGCWTPKCKWNRITASCILSSWRWCTHLHCAGALQDKLMQGRYTHFHDLHGSCRHYTSQEPSQAPPSPQHATPMSQRWAQ